MGAKDSVICHVCGFKNALNADRCVSCGAKIDAAGGMYSEEEASRHEALQKGFSWLWLGIAFGTYLVLQLIVLVALPAVIDSYDPQGFSALMLSVAVWFVGGLAVGFLSPGKTFFEPALGALFAVVPTILWVINTTPGAPEHLDGGFQLTMPVYILGGILGGLVSLFGAFLGEKAQEMTQKDKKPKR